MVEDLSNTSEVEPSDLFQMVLDVQQSMQDKCYPNVEEMFMEEKILISTRALVHEVLEVEDEVNWKHWKKDVEVDEEKVCDEIVDVFIFFMNLVNASDMTAKELIERTLDKIDINIERQKTGY